MKKINLTLLVCAVLLIVGGAVTTKLGLWPISATATPPLWEKSIAEMALHASLDRQSAGLQNPLAASNDVLVSGMKIFQNNCAGCHGSPGRPSQWGTRNFYPRVPQFAERSPVLKAPQMFIAIKYGIRYSGMGAWEGMMSDEEIWSVATFLENLDSLPPDVSAAWKPN